MITHPVNSTRSPEPPTNGARLVDTQGRTLPLRASALHVEARAGLARVVLEQTFVNTHEEPLRVSYQVPLPVDAAVSGFRFRLADTEVVGRVEPRQVARERFEQAMLEGKTAALLDEERSSLFTQEVGNVPPGVEVKVQLQLDQKLRWVAEPSRGGWEWRFPTVVAPRFLGEPGRGSDANAVVTSVSDDPLSIPLSVEVSIGDVITAAPESPSHAIRARQEAGRHRVTLDPNAGARLDRDVVVRWPVAGAAAGVTCDAARPEAEHPASEHGYALLTITPPAARPVTAIVRDLIVLLDTSGSMHGEPLDQAKRVVGALIDSLGEHDRLELIEFSTRPRRFGTGALPATLRNKAKAHAWLAGLQASGGTQMRDGILEALHGLRAEAQRQVVLVSDGLIGFEDEIVAAIAGRLPVGSRVHTVGIGAAVNRTLTSCAARAGRGQEVIIGLGEDPERATARLLAHTDAPLVVDVMVEGDAVVELAPAKIPDLFAGAPVLVSARIAVGGGRLRVHGRGPAGSWSQSVELPALEPGDGSASIPKLFARERVEDLEILRASGRTDSDPSQMIERLGVDFQISTRLTSWIAIADHPSVDPRSPSRHEVMPHTLPQGVSALGLGLRSAAAPQVRTMIGALPGEMMAAAPPVSMAPPAPQRARAQAKQASGPSGIRRLAEGVSRLFGGGGSAGGAPEPPDMFDADESTGAFEVSPLRDEPTASVVSLRGLVRRVGAKWIVTLNIERPLLWQRPEQVEVELESGDRIHVRVELDHSTRSGELTAGTSIRLSLEHGEDTVPRRLHWVGDDGRTWEVELGRG